MLRNSASPSDVNVLRVIPQITLDEQGTLFFRGRLVVPKFKDMSEKVMQEAHDTPLSIHPGSTKMYQDIRQRFWWSNMKQRHCSQYVAECDVCRRIKAEHQKPAGTLQPLVYSRMEMGQS